MTSASDNDLPLCTLSPQVEAEAAAWCTLFKHKQGDERNCYLTQLANALTADDRASLQLESRWEVVNTEDIPVPSHPAPVNAQDADRSWAGRAMCRSNTDDGAFSVPVGGVGVPSGSELQDWQMSIAMRGLQFVMATEADSTSLMDQDFDVKIQLELSSSVPGREGTSAQPASFTEFAPVVFRSLRDRCGITNAKFCDSIIGSGVQRVCATRPASRLASDARAAAALHLAPRQTARMSVRA